MKYADWSEADINAFKMCYERVKWQSSSVTPYLGRHAIENFAIFSGIAGEKAFQIGYRWKGL